MKHRLIRIACLSAIGLLLGGLIALFQMSATKQPSSPLAVSAENFGGPFTLTDHNGQVVTDENFAGQYRLIYFGFTFCPAICPTELQKITAVLDALGEKGKAIQPIFITVDPERDTVDVMKNYISLFHPNFVGLTGTQDQINAVMKAYKVYAAKVDDPALTDYTVDHSSFIYFMDPDDRLLSLYKIDDPATNITDNIKSWLVQSAVSG